MGMRGPAKAAWTDRNAASRVGRGAAPMARRRSASSRAVAARTAAAGSASAASRSKVTARSVCTSPAGVPPARSRAMSRYAPSRSARASRMASKRARRSSRRCRVSSRLRIVPVPRPLPRVSSSSASSRACLALLAAATSSAMATTAAATASASDACPRASCSTRSRVADRRVRTASSVSRARARASRPWLAAAAQAACSGAAPSPSTRAEATVAGGRPANASTRARDGMVATSASVCRVTSTNTTSGGGSSSTLSRALAAASVKRSASSRMNTALRPSWRERDASSRRARTSSTSRLSPSGSSRCTSGCTPRSTRRQTSQVPSPPAGQFRAAANTLARCTLPTPGGPVNTQAWITRPDWTASRRVATASPWPTTSSQTGMTALHAGEHGGAHLVGDLPGRQGGVDHDEPVGFGAGQVAEGPPDRAVELELLVLDAVPGAAPAGQADRRVEVKQDHHVGEQPAGAPSVDRLHRLDAEAAGGALVGEGRVDVAVAQDHGPAVQGRADDLLDELGPGGGEQQRLRPRVHASRGGVEQDLADALPERGASGLPGDDHLPAEPLEVPPEPPELGGLAAPLDALERDEPARTGDRVALGCVAHGGRRPYTLTSSATWTWLPHLAQVAVPPSLSGASRPPQVGHFWGRGACQSAKSQSG